MTWKPQTILGSGRAMLWQGREPDGRVLYSYVLWGCRTCRQRTVLSANTEDGVREREAEYIKAHWGHDLYEEARP